MNLNRKKFLQLLVTGGLGAMFAGAASIPAQWRDKGVHLTSVKRQSLVMGSLISFEVVAENQEAGFDAIRKAESIFRKLEKTFSMYDEESEMAQLARYAGKEFLEVSVDAQKLLKYSKEVSQQSRCLFDVTIEPAMKKWGFRKNPSEAITPPTDHELKNLERLIGSEKIEFDKDSVRLSEPGMAIDTGGIAGGYALDKAIKTIKKCDVSAAFINFSGDIHCFGQPLDGQYWPVHILDPHSRQPLKDVVKLSDQALSTSGAYQNRRHDRKNHSWGHLLLPRNVEPVEPVGSVTAVHASAMVADAWSTAAYVGATAPADVKITKLF